MKLGRLKKIAIFKLRFEKLAMISQTQSISLGMYRYRQG